VHNVTLKASQKGCLKRNGHVIVLKCFVEIDLHPFLLAVQSKERTMSPL
jgi:hypothetical protein